MAADHQCEVVGRVDAGRDEWAPADVAIVSTPDTIDRIAATNQEGRYLFRNVTPGSYAVRVLRLGYRPSTDSAHVAPGKVIAQRAAIQMSGVSTIVMGGRLSPGESNWPDYTVEEGLKTSLNGDQIQVVTGILQEECEAIRL